MTSGCAAPDMSWQAGVRLVKCCPSAPGRLLARPFGVEDFADDAPAALLLEHVEEGREVVPEIELLGYLRGGNVAGGGRSRQFFVGVAGIRPWRFTQSIISSRNSLLDL